MTNISFYISRADHLQARLLLACRLVEKAREHKMHTYIHVDTSLTAKRIDDLLWNYNDLSFIPHAIAPTEEDVPVLIGYDQDPIDNCDFLINLSNQVPLFFSRFKKMAEILDQSQEILNEGRQRYIFYRKKNYNLQYYQL